VNINILFIIVKQDSKQRMLDPWQPRGSLVG